MINLTPEAENRLPPSATDHYIAIKRLPDGRVCGVLPLLFHFSLHVDIHEFGWEDKYCYPNLDSALGALRSWDGTGDPADGWTRHFRSSRRRDLATGEEWIAA